MTFLKIDLILYIFIFAFLWPTNHNFGWTIHFLLILSFLLNNYYSNRINNATCVRMHFDHFSCLRRHSLRPTKKLAIHTNLLKAKQDRTTWKVVRLGTKTLFRLFLFCFFFCSSLFNLINKTKIATSQWACVIRWICT